jgi:hypothetical protein
LCERVTKVVVEKGLWMQVNNEQWLWLDSLSLSLSCR